jgi:DNA polymerase-2
MAEITGWLLDLYADPKGGLALWLLGEDGARYRLKQPFPITFYAAGPNPRLRALWQYLQAQPIPVELSRTERRDLFQPEPLTVIAIQTPQPADQPGLFARVSREFPDLVYYDADLGLSLRHAAIYGTFSLAQLQVTIDAQEVVQTIRPLDSPWDLDPEPAPLRILQIEPDCNPRHAHPKCLNIQYKQGSHPPGSYRLSLEGLPSIEAGRPLLVNLAAILHRHDPDLLLTAWGDTWLLPYLLELSKKLELPLPLNRDPDFDAVLKPERSYFSYGQVIHRGQQVHLFGRWHIDVYNAMMFHDYGLDGILESARVTTLPVQAAARLSPGTGISSMQILTALRQGVLVPWHKQQPESPKTALDLLHADQGGLVYQPLVGLHQNVAEVDFISMYPSIMARFNVSPETVGQEHAERVPELNLTVDRETPGLVPLTLTPLLDKRIALKSKIVTLPNWDPRRQVYKARASAQKWLLVTCFGYLGYKNARFGRIEAHQAVTAYSRECLLRAKEAAEDAGFTVLHMYVDGLWVHKPGCAAVNDFQPLLDEIAVRTHLPIALEGVYRWVAFLPSRMNEHVPVANRYFGVFQDGTLKVRGIEARRRDTPPFIAQTQMAVLEFLAQAPDASQLTRYLPDVVAFLRRQMKTLRAGKVPLAQLLVTLKLSRELDEYRTPSPAAQAAAQLEKIGKTVRPGQHVRLIYTRGSQRAYAWDLPDPLDPSRVDLARYAELFVRAASTVLLPLGVSEATLRDWLFSNAGYGSRPGKLPSATVAASGWLLPAATQLSRWAQPAPFRQAAHVP